MVKHQEPQETSIMVERNHSKRISSKEHLQSHHISIKTSVAQNRKDLIQLPKVALRSEETKARFLIYLSHIFIYTSGRISLLVDITAGGYHCWVDITAGGYLIHSFVPEDIIN